MKLIDKTNNKNYREYSYGDILKCWKNNSDFNNGHKFDLYRISYSGQSESRTFKACIIHDHTGSDESEYKGAFYSANALVENMLQDYDHVRVVRATIIIEDF